MWLSGGMGFGQPGDDGAPEVLFDLGGRYDLHSMKIWNYNEVGGNPPFLNRGVQDMEVFISTDGVAYTSLGTFKLSQATGVENVDFSDVISLGGLGAWDVRYVRFDILSNYNGLTYPTTAVSPDNAFVGLSEVQFSGTPAPEPATCVLVALGLAALGCRVRRRRARV